jgi:hypothetical protein
VPGVHYQFLNVLVDAKSAAPAQFEALMHNPKKGDTFLDGAIEDLFGESYREFISLPDARKMLPMPTAASTSALRKGSSITTMRRSSSTAISSKQAWNT